jgi:hypothetical protein
MKAILGYLLLQQLLMGAGWGASVEAFPVFGFGHGVEGGKGGRVLEVTRLDDDVEKPLPGMLRWALKQTGARVVKLAVAGDIVLKDRIVVTAGRVTVDGRGAPGMGACVRGGALEFFRCEEVILTGFRVRLGDETLLRKLKQQKRARPVGSRGLDCVNLLECRGVVLDHLSLSWSCDELLSVVRCRGVTVQWCLLAEPLGHPRLHPYGANHAYGINASASTLTVHHCVLAHYWMRGPQFEANDMRRGDKWEVKKEAVANVLYGFGRSGSRYTTGIEDRAAESRGRGFEFQFEGNLYLDARGTGKPIEAVIKHGTHAGVRVWVGGNWGLSEQGVVVAMDGVRLENGLAMGQAKPELRRQLSARRLFYSPNRPRADLGGLGVQQLLEEVGCSHARDKADERVLAEVVNGEVRRELRSQDQVGGWPSLRR